MQVSVKKTGKNSDIALLKIKGEIDTSNFFELGHSLLSVTNKGCYKIIVDLNDVHFISSHGWGVFIAELKEIRENGGDIVLCEMNPNIYDNFMLIELNHILKSFDTVEDGIVEFEQQS